MNMKIMDGPRSHASLPPPDSDERPLVVAGGRENGLQGRGTQNQTYSPDLTALHQPEPHEPVVVAA